jgi:hypothetical protein
MKYKLKDSIHPNRIGWGSHGPLKDRSGPGRRRRGKLSYIGYGFSKNEKTQLMISEQEV